MERERNYLIDAIKCLACFGIVMCHMATRSFGDEFYYIEAILGRCGVPIFFMISGYFAARHVKKDPENQRQVVFEKRPENDMAVSPFQRAYFCILPAGQPSVSSGRYDSYD